MVEKGERVKKTATLQPHEFAYWRDNMSSGSSSNMAVGFLLGAIIGGAIALLYAPAPGKEMRSNLKKKYDELIAKVEEQKEKMCQKV